MEEADGRIKKVQAKQSTSIKYEANYLFIYLFIYSFIYLLIYLFNLLISHLV